MSDIMVLIAKATWREAVTYRHTWPHEYVLMNKDQQHDLVAEFDERIERGEGVECQFFHLKKQYLFLGNHKYWTEGGSNDDEVVLNRALLYRDRRDFLIRQGDSGVSETHDQITPEDDEDIVQVDVRRMWPNEAWHFTHWLAEKQNLELLGKELGLSLELVQREKPIGSLYLDILAKETRSESHVAIENQLEWTDYDHLGRLLAYATGSDSRIAIWVAPEFVYEHAQILNQLNEWSGPNARFYGIKVEVTQRSGEDALVPRFRKVVYPGGWDKEPNSYLRIRFSPHVQKHRDFFNPLIRELLGAGVGFDRTPRQRFDASDRLFPSPTYPGIGYAVSFWKDHAWVTLHIQMEDNDSTKRSV